MKKSKEENVVEEKFNCFQMLNYFKLNGRHRRIAAKKYATQQQTVNEWEEILKKDKLLS